MTQNTHYFKLGLFVILSFCLFAGFLIVFGAGEFMKKELLAETCFDESVQGLDVGSEVKYKGVKIGTVKTITTPGKVYGVPSNYVLVVFALSEEAFTGNAPKSTLEGLQTAIGKGLRVYLSFKGLTGAAYLETDYFTDPPSKMRIGWKPGHPYVPSRKSSIKRLGDALNMILENLSHINVPGMTANLEELLETLNQKTSEFDLAGISQQAAAMLAEIRQTNQQLSGTLGSPQFKKMIRDAQDSFSGIKSIVENAKSPIDQTLKSIGRTADTAQNLTAGLEHKMDTKLKEVSRQVDALMTSLNTTVKMLETLVWLNTDTINKTIDNFEHTSENLKQLSIEIKHYPGRLLFEKPPEPLGGNPMGDK